MPEAVYKIPHFLYTTIATRSNVRNARVITNSHGIKTTTLF